MNDGQGEEGERREGSQECCCGVIVPKEREKGRGGGMLDLLPNIRYSVEEKIRGWGEMMLNWKGCQGEQWNTRLTFSLPFHLQNTEMTPGVWLELQCFHNLFLLPSSSDVRQDWRSSLRFSLTYSMLHEARVPICGNIHTWSTWNTDRLLSFGSETPCKALAMLSQTGSFHSMLWVFPNIKYFYVYVLFGLPS